MGAWDYGVFDDDSALDVMSELESCNNIAEYCEQAFDAAINAEYLEFYDGITASVCGAVVDSILYGTTYRYFFDPENDAEGEEQYLNWIQHIKSTNSTNFERLKDKAAQSLTQLISENSELCELWSENKELFPKWKGIYEQMIARLQA